MTEKENVDKFMSFANDAIKRTGLFITGLNNGSYTVGISFNEETRYEIVVPWLIDDVAINEVFQNKEIKHGDIVESKLYSVSVTPDTYNVDHRPSRYEVFDCEDPEVLAFLNPTAICSLVHIPASISAFDHCSLPALSIF